MPQDARARPKWYRPFLEALALNANVPFAVLDIALIRESRYDVLIPDGFEEDRFDLDTIHQMAAIARGVVGKRLRYADLTA